MSTLSKITTGALFTLLAAMAVDASAAVSIRVTCEVRPGRSTVSVDGRGLAAGNYTTQALSGSNIATSPVQQPVGGEIETDYASNPGDIAQGATPIAPNFISGARVVGKIVDSSGHTLASDTVACRVRTK